MFQIIKFLIIIRDNGIATSPERLNNINKQEKFNVDISGVRRYGMGLKISKQIIDLHQGTMTITSKQGKLFQTSMTLPMAQLNK